MSYHGIQCNFLVEFLGYGMCMVRRYLGIFSIYFRRQKQLQAQATHAPRRLHVQC